MTTQSVSPRTLHSASSPDADFGIQTVTELVVARLSGLHRINDQFVLLDATLGDDGYIHVQASQVRFGGDNETIRVLLYPTEPMSGSPQFTTGTKNAG
jgi:hypothetical protein